MPSGEVHGVTPFDTRLLRTFVEHVFEPLHRADQRRWAQAYLGALLSVSGKKTLRRLAQEVSPTSAAAHGLQRFINASSWEWAPIRRALSRTVADQDEPRAWSVAQLTIPKRGEHSVGVHRRFDAESGRTINCQVATGLFLATDSSCVPVDWRLILSDSWCLDERRRARARIPPTVAPRPEWTHILDFADHVAACPRLVALPWALDLRRTAGASGVMEGLTRRGLDFVCEVSAEQLVRLPQAGSPVLGIGELTVRNRTRQSHLVVRQVSAASSETFTMHSGSVRLPRRPQEASGPSRTYRSLTRPASRGRQNARFWITSLTDHRVEEVLALARSVTAAGRSVSRLEANFGVQDFEGRSFPGWHHHMTMTSAAYAFQSLYPSASFGTPLVGSCA